MLVMELLRIPHEYPACHDTATTDATCGVRVNIQRLPDFFEYIQHTVQDASDAKSTGGGRAGEKEGASERDSDAGRGTIVVRDSSNRGGGGGVRTVLVCSYQVPAGSAVQVNVRNCEIKDDDDEEEDGEEEHLAPLRMAISCTTTAVTTRGEGEGGGRPHTTVASAFKTSIKEREEQDFGQVSLMKDEERCWVFFVIFFVSWSKSMCID